VRRQITGTVPNPAATAYARVSRFGSSGRGPPRQLLRRTAAKGRPSDNFGVERRIDPNLRRVRTFQGVMSSNVRLTPMARTPDGVATWQVVGQPLRLVALAQGWMVVAVGDEGRRLLLRHNLLGRRFATRTAAVNAVSSILAGEAAHRTSARLAATAPRSLG
jgi:hypothetical protein